MRSNTPTYPGSRFAVLCISSMRLMVLIWFVALAACNGQMSGTGEGPGAGADAGPELPAPPPPPPPPPTPPAVYVRGSLPPLFELTPRAEYGRTAHKGIPMTDQDFQTVQTTTSAALKLDEIAAQISAERGTPITAIKRPEDRQRANLIPFRGNPSDVKRFTEGAIDKLYVPLGGDVTTPGNEIAVVSLSGNQPQLTARIRVGVRPQRVAVHPAGLIFVCNQYSNYISVIDPRTDVALLSGGKPVEVETEYFCADLVFAPVTPGAPDEDEQYLFVANRYRHTVLAYKIEMIRDPLSDRPVGLRQERVAEIVGVGQNPYRLALAEQQNVLFVASNRGGEVSRIDIGTRAVTARVFAGSPAADIVNIADQLFVPTLMPDRGLLARDEVQKPLQVLAPAVRMAGMDGQNHQVHPGALFDGTRSYNFEDIRNGLLQLDFQLAGQSTYYTDDVSSEPNFAGQQKVLAGALPQAIARNAAGTRVWVALSGSGLVQELQVNTAVRPFSVTPVQGAIFQTRERPFAISVDEAGDRLYVVSWGGEVLEVFDLSNRQRLATVDLGYAQPTYPATNIERGELLFYDAGWSNNGRKSCASCHFDELVADGVGYSNGATAPTAYHQVKPNFNLMTTDSYFWNGGFRDGNYTSVAFAAQVRTNCEVVLFGLVEGPGSNPATRIGDPQNRVTDGNDEDCRPDGPGADRLPANFVQVQQRNAAQKLIGRQVIENSTGLPADDVIRFMDFYSVAELRLPPNPLRALDELGQLDPATKVKMARGKELFISVGCVNCHDALNTRHPFTDGLEHGPGADWPDRFIATYQADQRVTDSLGSFPQVFLDGVSGSAADSGINVHVDPIDYFVPFCFDVSNCLSFEDPLAVAGASGEESRRLDLLIDINLADPDRGWIPGNVRGQPRINTPSLRGLWTQANLLHHGYAHRIAEAILPPGHPALGPGELGYAVSNSGAMDVHGATMALSGDDVDALVLYVLSIE